MIRVFKYIFFLFFLPFWYIQLLVPRNNKIWVFGCWFGQRYTDNSKSFFEFVLSDCKEIQPVWITKNIDVYNRLNSNGIPCEMSNSFKGVLICLRANIYIFSSGKKDINRLFMNGAKSVQLWHGAPMKKIGLDDEFVKNKFSEKVKKHFYPFNYEYDYDAAVSTSEVFNEKLCSAFNLNIDQILTSGYPRNDVFFEPNKKSNYLKKLNLKFKNPKIILYLPTFRDYEPDIDLFFRFNFNVKDWVKYLNETNTIFVYKTHFAGDMKEDLNDFSDRIIQFSDKEEPNLNLFMKDVDLLITDYSGAYFDFELTKKPLVLAPFDLEEYITKSRELYFDYEKFTEIKAINWPEVLKFLSKGEIVKLNRSNKYNDYNEGNSSSKLYTQIVNKFNIA